MLIGNEFHDPFHNNDNPRTPQQPIPSLRFHAPVSHLSIETYGAVGIPHSTPPQGAMISLKSPEPGEVQTSGQSTQPAKMGSSPSKHDDLMI